MAIKTIGDTLAASPSHAITIAALLELMESQFDKAKNLADSQRTKLKQVC